MEVWEIAILAVASFVAINTLVGLMRRRHAKILEFLVQRVEQERRAAREERRRERRRQREKEIREEASRAA